MQRFDKLKSRNVLERLDKQLYFIIQLIIQPRYKLYSLVVLMLHDETEGRCAENYMELFIFMLQLELYLTSSLRLQLLLPVA